MTTPFRLSSDQPVDYYALLGVTANCDAKSIEKAYKNLQRQFHPDKGGSAAMSQLLNEARDILLDEKGREKYDEDRCHNETDVQDFLLKLKKDPNSRSESDRVKEQLRRWEEEFLYLDLHDNFSSDLAALVETVLEQDPPAKFLSSEEKMFQCPTCSSQFLDHFDHFDQVLLNYVRAVDLDLKEMDGPIFKKLKNACHAMLATNQDDIEILKMLQKENKGSVPQNSPVVCTPLEKLGRLLTSQNWTKLTLTLEQHVQLIVKAVNSAAPGGNFKYIKIFESLTDKALNDLDEQIIFKNSVTDHVTHAVAAKTIGDDLGVVLNIITSFRRSSSNVQEYLEQVSTTLLTGHSDGSFAEGHLDILNLAFHVSKAGSKDIVKFCQNLFQKWMEINGPVSPNCWDAIVSLCEYAKFVGKDGENFENFRFTIDSIQYKHDEWQDKILGGRVDKDDFQNFFQDGVKKYLELGSQNYEMDDEDVEPILDDLFIGLTFLKVCHGVETWDDLMQPHLFRADDPISKKMAPLLYMKASHHLCAQIFSLEEKVSRWRALEHRFRDEGDKDSATLCCLATEVGDFEKAQRLLDLNQHYLASKLLLKFDTCDLDFFATLIKKTQNVHYVWAGIERLEKIKKIRDKAVCLTQFVEDNFIRHSTDSKNRIVLDDLLQSIVHTFGQSATELFMAPVHHLILQHSCTKSRILAAIHFIQLYANVNVGHDELVNERLANGMEAAISCQNIQYLAGLLFNLDTTNLEALSAYFESKQGNLVLESAAKNEKNRKPIPYTGRRYHAMLYMIRGTQAKILKNFNATITNYCLALQGLVGEDLDSMANGLALLLQDSAIHEEIFSKFQAELRNIVQGCKSGDFHFDAENMFLTKLDHTQILRSILDSLNAKGLSIEKSARSAFRWEDYVLGLANPIDSAFAYLDYKPTLNSRVLAAVKFVQAMKSESATLAQIYSYTKMIEELLSLVALGRDHWALFMKFHFTKIALSLLLEAYQILGGQLKLERSTKGPIKNRENALVSMKDVKKLTIKQPISRFLFSQQSQSLTKILLLDQLRTIRIQPLVKSKMACNVDTEFLETFGQKFVQNFLALKVCETRPSEIQPTPVTFARFQYAQFEELWKGRIAGTLADFEETKIRTMDTLLGAADHQMEDVLDFFYWPFGQRTKEGWRDMNKIGMHFPGDAELFSKLDGYRLDKKSGEITLLLRKDTERPLFTMSDIQEIFQLGLVSAAFTLEDPGSDYPCHPFQEARYGPSRMRGSRYLATLLQADILLKELTTGTEINSIPPFSGRPTSNGILSKLPPYLQKILRPIHARDEETKTFTLDISAHRFWIDVPRPDPQIKEDDAAIEVTFPEATEEGSGQNLCGSQDGIIIRKHKLMRNAEGHLVDAEEDSSDESSESAFAREFTQSYDEIGQYFPELLRLGQLMRINVVSGHLKSVLENIEKDLSEVDATMRPVVEGVLNQVGQMDVFNRANIEAEFHSAIFNAEAHIRGQGCPPSLVHLYRSEIEAQARAALVGRENSARTQIEVQLNQICHARSSLTNSLNNWLTLQAAGGYGQVFSICFDGLCAHRRAELIGRRDVLRRNLGICNFAEDKTAEDEAEKLIQKECSWVPAVFFSGVTNSDSQSTTRRLIHGGVAMGMRSAGASSGSQGAGRGNQSRANNSSAGRSNNGGGGGGGDDDEWIARQRRMQKVRERRLEKRRWPVKEGYEWQGLIYGRAQVTGSKLNPNHNHAQQIYWMAVNLAKAGHKVFLNTAVRTVTGNPNDSGSRPDLMWLDRGSGRLHLVEKASKTDIPSKLDARLDAARVKMPDSVRGTATTFGYKERIEMSDLELLMKEISIR